MFYVIIGSQGAAFRDLLGQVFDVMGKAIPAATTAKNSLNGGASPEKAVQRFMDILLAEQNRQQHEYEGLKQRYSELSKKLQDETNHFIKHRIEVADAVKRTSERMEKECQARCDALKAGWDADKQKLHDQTQKMEEMERELDGEILNQCAELGQQDYAIKQLKKELEKANRHIESQNAIIADQQKRIKSIVGPD